MTIQGAMPPEIATLLAALQNGGTGAMRVADWRVNWTWRQEVSAAIRDSEPLNVHAPLAVEESTAAGVLVQWADGRLSRRRVERAEAAQPERFLEAALASAYEDSDGAVFVGPTTAPEVPLFVPETAAVAAGHLDPLAEVLSAARSVASSHGFRNLSGSVSAVHARSGVRTSRGCDLADEVTRFTWWFSFEGLASESDQRREPIPGSAVRERLAEPADRVGRLLHDEANVLPGPVPVLLHPNAAESFLFTYLLGNLEGDLVWNRRSAFRREQFDGGASVAREDLSVRLDPLVPFGAGSYHFTREGVVARKVDLIASGRLTTPILDLKYARRFGREPVPGPLGAESLVFASRPFPSSEEAIGGLDRGLVVFSVLGLHTQDPTSGDFSVAAPQSLAIRAGRLGGRVRAALTGNFLQALHSPDMRLVRFPGQPMPGILLPAGLSVDAVSR